MALTITKTGDWQGTLGNRRFASVTIAFDSSYPTGGESLTPEDLGLRTIDFMNIEAKSGIVFEYDYTNEKVLAYVPGMTVGADGAEVLIDAPLSGVGSSTTQSVGVVDASVATRFGVMLEVASTEDLSSITSVRVFAIGV